LVLLSGRDQAFQERRKEKKDTRYEQPADPPNLYRSGCSAKAIHALRAPVYALEFSAGPTVRER
jgi:hypothetical protein